MRMLALFLCLISWMGPAAAAPARVIVIAMENKDALARGFSGRNYIYGNMRDAPYINGVLAGQGSRAARFTDELSKDWSLPHYILMEAGRTVFDDAHFTCDNDPGRSCELLSGRPNWTRSREHLTAQIEAARHPALSWMTYQEGIDPATTGACPVRSAGRYAAKHNPFVYFADVAGAPPDPGNAHCIAHTRNFSRFLKDMHAGSLASYVFITPDLCHDMHGGDGCPKNEVAAGDAFLKSFLPEVISWARENRTVVFVVWDEGSAGTTIPFYAAGFGIKVNHESKVPASHRALLKTIERIFGLPVLDAVRDATDLADMFEPGVLP